MPIWLVAMLQKDKTFKSIMREFKSELSSFEDLRVVPVDIYETIIEPLLTVCCDKFLGGENVFYSIRKEMTSYDKSTAKLEITVGLHMADSADFRFKHYQIMLTFGGTGK